MPTCPVKHCHFKSQKKRNGISNDENITFHRLPKDSNRRKQWIINLSLDEKRVTDNTLICSQHFCREMFDRTSVTCVRLRQNATPKVVGEYLASEPRSSKESQLKRKRVLCNGTVGSNEDVKHILINDEIHAPVNLQTSQNDAGTSIEAPNDPEVLCNRSTCMTPIRIINSPIKTQLRKTIKQQRAKYCQKIKILQQSCRRKNKRIAHLQNVIKELCNKRFIDEEQLQMPNSLGMYHSELLKRSIKKRTKKFSPELRTFALTLHYYSPRAYQYVRESFESCLPHSRTISRWYSTINGEPGFSEEALKAIKLKVVNCTYKLICCLMYDEMKQFVGNSSLFRNIQQHTANHAPAHNHIVHLIKLIIQKYLKVRLGYIYCNQLKRSESIILKTSKLYFVINMCVLYSFAYLIYSANFIPIFQQLR